MYGLAQVDAAFPLCLSWFEIAALGPPSQQHSRAIVAPGPASDPCSALHAKGHRSHVICRPGPASPRRPALAGPGRGGYRPADGGSGFHGREHRAAVGAAFAGVPERRPAVGGDGLRPGLRQPAAGGRQARRHVQPQVGLHHGPGRIRRLLGHRGRRRLVRDAGGGPGAAGRVRRPPRAVRPRYPGQHLPGPARAGAGLRGLRLGRGRRRRRGPDPRRGAHPVPVLALDALHQFGVRRDRRGRCPGLHAQQPARHPATDGLARGGTGLRRAFPYSLRLLPRRDRRLGRPR